MSQTSVADTGRTEEPSPLIAGWEWLLLAFCTLVGSGLRCLNLAGRPLWVDEITTLITLRRPLDASLFNYQDPQPPLYQFLLRGLPVSDHPSEWALRWPSVAAGCLTIPAAWYLARLLLRRLGSTGTTRRTALLVALLVAANPVLIHYSREARPYALFALATTLSLIAFYQLLNQPAWKRVPAYALATAMMFWSHYYAVFFLAGQIAYALADGLFLRREISARRKLVPVVVGMCLALLAGSVPLTMFAWLLQSGMPGSWWINRPAPIEGFETLGEMLGIQALGILCVIPLLATLWPTSAGFDRMPKPEVLTTSADADSFWLRRREALFCAMAVFSGLFLPLIGSMLLKPGFVARYALPVAVPMLILGVLYLQRTSRLALLLMVLVALGFSLLKTRAEIQGEQGMREVVKYIQDHSQPGAAVHVLDWNAPALFKRDFISPETVGLRLYGLTDRDLMPLTQPPTWNASQLADYRLPEGRLLVVGYGSTANSLREYLTKIGRPFTLQSFGAERRALHVLDIPSR